MPSIVLRVFAFRELDTRPLLHRDGRVVLHAPLQLQVRIIACIKRQLGRARARSCSSFLGFGDASLVPGGWTH